MARPWRAQGRGQQEIGRRSHLIEGVAPLLAEGAVRVQRVVPGGVGVVMEHLGQEVEKVMHVVVVELVEEEEQEAVMAVAKKLLAGQQAGGGGGGGGGGGAR